MKKVSVKSPRQPQRMPTAVPTTVITDTSNSVENTLALLPAITLESMSLP